MTPMSSTTRSLRPVSPRPGFRQGRALLAHPGGLESRATRALRVTSGLNNLKNW